VGKLKDDQDQEVEVYEGEPDFEAPQAEDGVQDRLEEEDDA